MRDIDSGCVSKSVTIGELIDKREATIQTGPFGTMLKASAYVEEGTPVVAVQHIGENRIIHAGLPKISPEDSRRLERYKLQRGDIVFGRKGAVDRRAYISPEEEGWIQGSDCIRLRIKSENFDSKFVSYVLGSPGYREWICRNAQGATMPSLNQEIIRRIQIPFIPIVEQRAVSTILGTFDDKIELNRQMNETMEVIARTIFKSWFIDFDPVRSKIEGRKPYGMIEEMAALFPDSFEDSELGEIPKGWITSSLGEFIDLDRGLSYKGANLAESGIPMVNLGNIVPLGGYREEGIKFYNGKFKERHTIKPGNIVIANTDITQNRQVLGSPAIIPNDLGQENVLFSHHLYAVRSDGRLPTSYIFNILKAPDYRGRVEGYATGTTVLALPKDAFVDCEIIVPSQAILNAFASICNTFLSLQSVDNIHNKTLASIRNALLPRLISGEICVEPQREKEKV